MQQIAQFFKVSEEQFVRDWCTATRRSADEAKKVYQNIQLPRRATKGSAGYDFFAPESFTLVPHETILIHKGKTLSVAAGDGFAQGIFLPFGITVDDEADGERTGGFGSTTEKK